MTLRFDSFCFFPFSLSPMIPFPLFSLSSMATSFVISKINPWWTCLSHFNVSSLVTIVMHAAGIEQAKMIGGLCSQRSSSDSTKKFYLCSPMGKKPFIDRKQAKHYHVVHRSQRDPLIHDADASDRVLKEVIPPNMLKVRIPINPLVISAFTHTSQTISTRPKKR